MQLRHAALVAVLVIQGIAAVVLAVKASGGTKVTVDEDALAEAQAVYDRRATTSPAEPSMPEPTPASERRPEATTSPEPSGRDDDEPSRSGRTRERPTPAPAAEEESSSGDEVEVDDVRAPFDSGRFMEALELAEAYLERDPDQAYIQRVAVTSACATGEIDTALDYYEQMNERDQRTSQHRCSRYNVDLEAEL